MPYYAETYQYAENGLYEIYDKGPSGGFSFREAYLDGFSGVGSIWTNIDPNFKFNTSFESSSSFLIEYTPFGVFQSPYNYEGEILVQYYPYLDYKNNVSVVSNEYIYGYDFTIAYGFQIIGDTAPTPRSWCLPLFVKSWHH